MPQSAPFATFFERVTGHPPYAYQAALGEADAPPAVLEVPTGSGKTQALLAAWLYRRQSGEGPRRLVYALPMRSLVEQTLDVANDMRGRLNIDPDALPIHPLMGGVDPPEGDWRMRPEADQILIGTIDLLISRALNRGYAESRFAWPVSFGLLNADCHWVFDEVQLMGPARATSAQLAGLRTKLGVGIPCETTWVSATVDRVALETVDRPDFGSVLSLPDEDRANGLATRLNADKRLERVALGDTPANDLPGAIATVARERHIAGTRTLVVVNTVGHAQSIFSHLEQLAGGPDEAKLVLVHSRFRPPERRRQMQTALAEPVGQGTIVVATQVVEAGVDMSARTLVTEIAPFSSVVQRLGRCNRAGEFGEATALWLDTGPFEDSAVGRKAGLPYLLVDLNPARKALLMLEGSSVSPAALERIDVFESAEDPAILRRRDLLDLFDTSPDLSGMDIDVAPFIREDDERNVSVFFRDLGTDPVARIADEPAPWRDELVQVPLGQFGDRGCWMLDHLDGDWLRRKGREIPPGATVLLNAAEGGYSTEIGWAPKEKAAVAPNPPDTDQRPEGMGSDERSVGSAPQVLLDHLHDVATEASAIAEALGLDPWRDILHAAGALHDVGKAHPVFQATLRTVIDARNHPDRDEHLWAKSGARGGRHERKYFRHELSSALALGQLDGEIDVPAPALTAYLVAAHHGKVRLSIRPASGEEPPAGRAVGTPFALGNVEGDRLPEVQTPIGTVPPTTLDLAPMELGADNSWTDAALGLRDDPELGPFRLALLEALLRIADWRASA